MSGVNGALARETLPRAWLTDTLCGQSLESCKGLFQARQLSDRTHQNELGAIVVQNRVGVGLQGIRPGADGLLQFNR